MADPLSIASGVAGLVSLGLTLCGGLHNYLSSVKSRHQDIESASRSLTLSQSNLFIIQSSTLKLGHRHALSANGVNQGLANCEHELVALQQLMLNLTRDEGLTDMKEKMRKQLMMAKYPFDQKRLVQLQDQLSKANAILSSFVQSFNLDVNIGISEDLRVLKNYTDANDSITHNLLRTIARRLDTISPTVQRTQMELAMTSRHIQEHCLIADPAGSHVSGVSMQPRYVQNSQREASLINELTDPKCTCSDPRPTYIHRKSSYINRSWGKWVIEREEHKRQCHRPGCMFLSQSLQTSKTTWSYLGFRYWLSRSLSLSLTRAYPAGAYSLSFGIQACNVVKSSPAFEVIAQLERAYVGLGSPIIIGDRPIVWLQEIISNLLKILRNIYTSGSASPFDVDEDGRNIAHKFMKLYRKNIILLVILDLISLEDLFEVTRSFLLCMFDLGVSITASSFYQETIIEDIWRKGSLGWLPQWYNFITTLDTSFDFSIEGNKKSNFTYLNYFNTRDEDSQVWAKYPEIAESFGFVNIFRIVMQRDRQKLEAIIMGDQQPPDILETDMYGRNILHACITWPAGLDLLLQQSQVLSLLHNNESNSASPLEIAILFSGRLCNQAGRRALCSDCDCAIPVQQLLEADCCLPGHNFNRMFIDLCSLRCRELLFKHLEDRRRRLRDLSFAILPSKVIERYGVTLNSVPDATASFLWEELQSRSDEWRKQGYRISGGLKPFSRKHPFGGLFERCLSPEVCSLASKFRIRPSDERGIRPLLARVAVSNIVKLEPIATYLNWLMKHDLELEYVTNGFQTSVLHDWGGQIGRFLREKFRHPILDTEVVSLIAKICNSDIGSNLPCPCVSGAFNRPLASLFSGYIAYESWMALWSFGTIGDVCLLVDLIGRIASNVDASYLARCAVHAITMELLGTRHVGPCGWVTAKRWRPKVLDEDERSEILDEDSFLLEKLSNLDEEFAREFESRNESVADFLRGHYTERMEEVVKEMDVPLEDDNRRGLLAAGVVLAEPK